jgi:lipopolysaccharide transport system permease protein
MSREADVLVIEAGRGDRRYWADVWKYREVLYFLSWRDLLVRYKQTVVGVGWAVLRPLLAMLVFTVVFGIIGRFPSEGVPYALLVYAGMLPWQFFSGSVSEANNSLIGNANLISKVYFPRILIPMSALLSGLVDLAIAAALLLPLMLYFGVLPDWRIVFLPVFVGLAFATALGFGLLFGALTVKYRDFRYVLPFLVQLGLYISPVGFSSTVVPERWRLLYSLNPMVGVIDGFRWSLFAGNASLYWPGVALSVVIALAAVIVGLVHFRRSERGFVDLI